MAIPISSDKYRIQKLLSEIVEGKPVRPLGKAWTVRDVLMLAGVCKFMIVSHGPQEFGGPDTAQMPFEHAEATSQGFIDDVDAAMEWQANVAQHIHDGDYDDYFKPVHSVVVQKREGKLSAQLVSGHMDLPEHEN